MADQELADAIARIDRDPLLKALHQIADLGSCGGRGGLQRAVDIAVAAICRHDEAAREMS